MHPAVQDLWYGARLLRKTPSVTALAVVTLALGSGAGTAIFSIVDTALWKALPFRDARSLVVMWERNPALDRDRMFVAPANLPAWQQNRSFEALGAVETGYINLTGGPYGHIAPEELRVDRVSANLFPILGVSPSVGRVFGAEEDRPGQAGVAVLSARLWQRRFGGDRQIPGKSIRLRDQVYQVLGVMPAGFSVLDPQTDIWLPLKLSAGNPDVARARTLAVIGRLKAGVTPARAAVEMNTIGARLEQANPQLDSGWRPNLFSLRDELVGKSAKSLRIILGAAGLLLLMACANVANLLLVRGASRQRELAVRSALGATRGRIVVQLLGESTLLALAGGVAGFLLAPLLLAALAHLGASTIPRIAEAHLDLRVLLFAVAVSLLTGLLCGAVPAWHSSGAGLSGILAEEGRGGTGGRAGRLTRSLLVILEVALAVVVLIAAGLLVRSYLRLSAANPGFQVDSLLTFRLPMAGGRNTAPERRAPFVERITQRLAVLPGVRGVGAVDGLPLTGLGIGSSFAVEGQPEPGQDRRPLALVRSVTDGYFSTMNIPIRAGRQFNEFDRADAPPVAMVDQTLAQRFFSNGDPLTGRLMLDQVGRRVVEIVGVVGAVKPESVDGEDWPTIYIPYAQRPLSAMSFAVRTARSPLALAATVERQVHEADPEQPVANVRSMDRVAGDSRAEARFHTVLIAAFAELAFLLCAVGIYGVISYDAAQRTREIGLRMALGAQPADIRRMMLGQAAMLAGCGIALGLAAAFLLTRLLASMLYVVKPSDFSTFATVVVLLGAVAMFASYLPSRRAMALDPVVALRHE